MRIPPSAIVMTLVIAVPFGLAIRDSVKGNDLQSKKEREVAEAKAAELEAEAARDRAQKAEYEAEKRRDAERVATFASLIGKDRGTLGSRFAIQVGDPSSPELEGQLDRLEGLESRDGEKPGLQVDANDKIVSLSFTIGEDHCGEMRTTLETAWGAASDGVWLDVEHHRRASLGGLLCTLHFDQYVDDTAWVDKALPALLGKTARAAIKLMGPTTAPQSEGEDSDLSWYVPGATSGQTSTEIVAIVVDGKIKRTIATTTVTLGQASDLVAAITKQLGTRPGADVTGTYVWKQKLVEATYNDRSSRFTVEHGITEPDETTIGGE